MEEKIDQLDPDVAEAITVELSEQVRQCFDKVVETDWQLTRTNLLLNAGGGAATLAFIGQASTPPATVWTLIVFVVGVVAGGVEVRALLRIYSALHLDALRRREGFTTGSLSVAEAVPSQKVAAPWDSINHWSGLVSQFAFVAGAIVGLALLVVYAP